MKRKTNFYLRRLHSFTGVVPIGIFLFMHLTENFSVLLEESYSFLGTLVLITESPIYYRIKMLCLDLPLLFHVIYGIYLYTVSKVDIKNYKTVESVKFYLQRITGVVVLIFVFAHISPLVTDSLNEPLVLIFYLVGAISTVFHFTNGLSAAAMTWGICITEKSQKKFDTATNVLFVILSVCVTVTAILL